MLGNLVAQTADSRRAELDVLRPVTLVANGPANASGLPMGCVTPRDATWLKTMNVVARH